MKRKELQMFTTIKGKSLGGALYIEGVCLSTDAKPTTGIANGSLCLEIDTGKIYAFNGVNSSWVEIA